MLVHMYVSLNRASITEPFSATSGSHSLHLFYECMVDSADIIHTKQTAHRLKSNSHELGLILKINSFVKEAFK